MACEWAVDYRRDGYVNYYDLECEGLKVLNLNTEGFTILHWLTILLENRTFTVDLPLAREGKRYLLENFHTETQGYDIIRGYRADDSYFSFAQDFLSGTVSVRQLSKAMYLGELGEQVVLKSPEAFERIKHKGSEYVPAAEWYGRKAARDHAARKAYLEMDKNGWVRGDIYGPYYR